MGKKKKVPESLPEVLHSDLPTMPSFTIAESWAIRLAATVPWYVLAKAAVLGAVVNAVPPSELQQTLKEVEDRSDELIARLQELGQDMAVRNGA